MSKAKKRKLRDISLESIRNANELKVINQMDSVINQITDYELRRVDIEDIYALALNFLPPRYVQPGSYPEDDDITDEDVCGAIEEAIRRVVSNPNE